MCFPAPVFVTKLPLVVGKDSAVDSLFANLGGFGQAPVRIVRAGKRRVNPILAFEQLYTFTWVLLFRYIPGNFVHQLRFGRIGRVYPVFSTTVRLQYGSGRSGDRCLRYEWSFVRLEVVPKPLDTGSKTSTNV
jgi:hypothetical protein